MSAVLSGVALFGISAPASAAPVSPYTAFTVDGRGGWFLRSAAAWDPSNSTIQINGGDSLIQVDMKATDGSAHSLSAIIGAPVGQTLAPGTYQATQLPDATLSRLDVFGDGRGCAVTTGSFTIDTITVDPASKVLTSLAMSYMGNCEVGGTPIYGEIRVNSPTGYAAAATDILDVDFGSVSIGATSAARTYTVTSRGSEALTLGTAAITGASAAAYSIGTDTCSNQSLSYGQSCSLSVTSHPETAGTLTATLVMPDNTVSGGRVVNLTTLAASTAAAGPTPDSVDFVLAQVNHDSLSRDVVVTSTGQTPVTLQAATITGADPGAFAIATDGCSHKTLAPAQTCTMKLLGHPTAQQVFTATLVIPDNGTDTQVVVPMTVRGTTGAEGTYYPLPPRRLMDTRFGNGAPRQPIGPNRTVHLQVAGRGGVPDAGVSAVVLNVTVTAPTVGGYLTVFPTGVARPTASSLNFVRGWTGANSVTVKLGTHGQVDLYNLSGDTSVIVDVAGFYAADNTVLDTRGLGGQFQPTVPRRLLDTRRDGGALPPKYMVTIPVFFNDPLDQHIRAFAVNITAVNPTSSGYLSAWNGWGKPPGTSTLNFTKGAIVPNMAIVPAAPCAADPSCDGMSAIAVYNASDGATHVLVDIVGVYDDSTIDGGLRFRPITPTRIADTRRKQGAPHALGRGETVAIMTPTAITGGSTVAIATNLTAVAPTQATYLTVWPAGVGLARPTVSNLNPAQGQTVPNAVVTLIGPGDSFNVFNYNGTTNICVDVVGTFYPGLTATRASLTRPTFRATPARATPLVPQRRATVRRAVTS